MQGQQESFHRCRGTPFLQQVVPTPEIVTKVNLDFPEWVHNGPLYTGNFMELAAHGLAYNIKSAPRRTKDEREAQSVPRSLFAVCWKFSNPTSRYCKAAVWMCGEREELEKVEGGGVRIRTEGKMSWRFTEAEFFVHFKKKSFYCIPCFKRQRPESGVYTLDPSCTWAPINCPRNNIAPL